MRHEDAVNGTMVGEIHDGGIDALGSDAELHARLRVDEVVHGRLS